MADKCIALGKHGTAVQVKSKFLPQALKDKIKERVCGVAGVPQDKLLLTKEAHPKKRIYIDTAPITDDPDWTNRVCYYRIKGRYVVRVQLLDTQGRNSVKFVATKEAEDIPPHIAEALRKKYPTNVPVKPEDEDK